MSATTNWATNNQRQHSYHDSPRTGKRCVACLSIAQIVNGIVAVILGLALFVSCSYSQNCTTYNWVCRCDKWTNVGANLWGGIVVTVCSAFAYCKLKSPTKLPDPTIAIMGLAGASTSFVVFGLEVSGAVKTDETVRLQIVLHSLSAVLFFMTGFFFLLGTLVESNDDLWSKVLMKMQPSTNYDLAQASQQNQEDAARGRSRCSEVNSFVTTSGPYPDMEIA